MLEEKKDKKPSANTSQWQTQLDDVIRKIESRQPFSYDMNGDALYQQYKDSAIKQGSLAMQDAMGKAATMTGGYGNSYAQSVGQQAYQASLDKLNGVIPELYQMAYNRYAQEGQDLYNQYALYSGFEERDYGRQRDSVADAKWQAEFDLAKGKWDAEQALLGGNEQTVEVKYADLINELKEKSSDEAALALVARVNTGKLTWEDATKIMVALGLAPGT